MNVIAYLLINEFNARSTNTVGIFVTMPMDILLLGDQVQGQGRRSKAEGFESKAKVKAEDIENGSRESSRPRPWPRGLHPW